MATVYFSTGSNEGDRLSLLVQAAKLIDSKIGNIIDYSPVVESEPWGFDADITFYNQVLAVETEFTPHQVLNQLLEIENTLGRKRSGKEYVSRLIDIDILFYDNIQIDEDNLVIPHPLLQKRKFVLKPLAFIAPDLIHPILQVPTSDLLDMLNDTSQVTIAVEKEEFTLLLNQ
jgi:2-amino-4-hydroxy-6-hydroxymethyldihydropteridine diphosphokinase